MTSTGATVHFCQKGLKSLLAHDQRMGDRALRVGDVRGIPHLGHQLRRRVCDAEIASARGDGANRSHAAFGLRHRRNRRRHLHDRPDAASLPFDNNRNASRSVRHKPAGATSFCSAPDQCEFSSKELEMGRGAEGFGVDRCFAPVRLRCVHVVHSRFCRSAGAAGLWSRR